MTIAECQVETIKHIEMVRKYIKVFTDALAVRGIKHDSTKLETPEVEVFAEFTPKLAGATYGSEEYNNFLKEMNVSVGDTSSLDAFMGEFTVSKRVGEV